MSIASIAAAAAIAQTNLVEGQAVLEYSEAYPGPTWVALSNSVLHVKDVAGAYLESSNAEGTDQGARMTVPLDQTALQVGWFVRRGESDTDIWAIVDGPEGTTSRAYELQRQPVENYKPDRGRY